MIESPEDPFAPVHDRYVIKDGKLPYEDLPYLNNVSFCASERCNAKLIGRYSYILQETCSIHGLSNLRVMVYPGTICEINGKEMVFAVQGRSVYVPGKICENFKNTKAFIEVTAAANFMWCLLSVDRIAEKKPWAHHSEVVNLAKTIFGEAIAEDIKIYYEII